MPAKLLKKRLVSRRPRFILYIISTLLWLTGMAWLGFKYFFVEPGDWGASPHTMILQLHGALAFGFLIILGFILNHVRPGWRQDRQRPSGLSLMMVCTVLILTGWGLYYLGNDHDRNVASYIHSVIGAGFPIFIGWHVWNAKQQRKTVRPKKGLQQKTQGV